MNYLYLTIFGRGLINKVEVVMHQLYLCMKMPASKVIITIRGNQQLARDIERGVSPGQRNVHVLETEIEKPQFKEPKRDKEWATFEKGYEVKRIPLDKHMPDKAVTISATLSTEEEKSCLTS